MAETRGRITGLAHIGIKVKDIDASIKFYTELLGFELTHKQQMGTSTLAFLNAGTCLLELIQSAVYEERTPGQVDHVAVEVKGIDELVSRLRAQGVQFLSDSVNHAPTLLDGVNNIFFLGPDGERIEFFEYYNR